jgi:ribosomal protein L29
MSTLKAKDIQKMSKDEKEKKLKELKLELIKSKVNASKTGSSKIKEIKKIIARILTLNK